MDLSDDDCSIAQCIPIIILHSLSDSTACMDALTRRLQPRSQRATTPRRPVTCTCCIMDCAVFVRLDYAHSSLSNLYPRPSLGASASHPSLVAPPPRREPASRPAWHLAHLRFRGRVGRTGVFEVGARGADGRVPFVQVDREEEQHGEAGGQRVFMLSSASMAEGPSRRLTTQR